MKILALYVNVAVEGDGEAELLRLRHQVQSLRTTDRFGAMAHVALFYAQNNPEAKWVVLSPPPAPTARSSLLPQTYSGPKRQG